MSVALPEVLDLAAIRAVYAAGERLEEVLAALGKRIDLADPAIFITRTPEPMLREATAALRARAPEPNSLPLWGVPFAVKDNIDVAGMPTTCACPAFARTPGRHAAVVAKLVEAGAIVVGKTNLDQFATGLSGTRSPYGVPRSSFDSAHISGGSSSGSAVAVASGLASFALGTDTAGSGRVPPALNNIVGIKPTPGLLSTRGVVPACESLDCVSIFALSVADGVRLRQVAQGHDPADPWSRAGVPRALPLQRLRVGVLSPEDRRFFGADDNARLYRQAIERCGDAVVEIDYTPFAQAAALLYDGPQVAERVAAFESFGVPEAALDPTVRSIFAGAARFSAADAFRASHELERLRRACAREMARADLLLLPTAPRSFTVAEMEADPIGRNAVLGTYTNFCNLLGLAAIAVPAGFSAEGLPFGVTVVGPALSDDAIAPLADRLHAGALCGAGIDRATAPPTIPAPLPPGEERIELAVVGAHLSGMALNNELQALDARLVAPARTAADYRLFVLPGTVPAKPGLVRSPGANGPGLQLEIWSLSPAAFGRFVAAVPKPLGIGKIELSDGALVSGFLCESWAVADAREITHFGGWRAFVSAGDSSS